MVETKNQITDGELVLKIAGYNAQAFEQLYSRYSSFLYSLIKKIIGDSKLSEKVLLNVFAIFWKRIEFYDATTNNVYTHLTMLTRNRAIDVLKRMDEHKLAPAYDDVYEFEKIMPKLSPVMKPISLEFAMAFAERIRFYKTQLTEVQNLILNMIFFEGLSDDEIAKKLNVPEATIKQKVQTVLGTLMQNLAGKNLETTGNKKIIDLIKLDAIGRLSKDEKEYLTNQKLEDPEFPWAILGEYQNLVALLATTVVPENPPTDLTNEIKKLFSNVLIGNYDEYNVVIPNKFTKSEPTIDNTESKQEDFPIRFKEPSKQELEIIEEISQIVPEPVKIENKVEEKISEKLPEQPLVENKSVTNSASESRPVEIKSTPKVEVSDIKPAAEIQNKVSPAQVTEQIKTTKEVKPKQPDPIAINRTINEILSRTDSQQSKPNDTKVKKTISTETVKREEKKIKSLTDDKPQSVESKQPDIKPEKDNVKSLTQETGEKKGKSFDNKDEKTSDLQNKYSENKSQIKPDNKVENKSEEKLKEDEHNIERLIEDYKITYEKEIGELQKKLRRNLMITAALIILLIGGGLAIYFSLQKDPVNLVTKVEQPLAKQTKEQKTQMPVEQSQSQSELQTDKQQPVKETQPTQNDKQKTQSEKREEQKVVYPPLPEAPKIQKPADNNKTNNVTNNNQNNVSTIQPKTEKPKEEIIPPKEEKPLTEEPSFFVAVEEPPQPVGGLASIQNKIVYPVAAKSLGIEGKVLIQAIIDERGNVAKAKVIKGIGSGCDEAALDAVKSSKFTPGKQRGKNVRVQITIPIIFKL
jgi:protein TonB